MEILKWIGVLFILALAVVPHRLRQYLSQNKARLAIDLAFGVLALAIVLLWLGW